MASRPEVHDLGPFAGIARLAKGLDVLGVTRPTKRNRDNVVGFEWNIVPPTAETSVAVGIKDTLPILSTKPSLSTTLSKVTPPLDRLAFLGVSFVPVRRSFKVFLGVVPVVLPVVLAQTLLASTGPSIPHLGHLAKCLKNFLNTAPRAHLRCSCGINGELDTTVVATDIPKRKPGLDALAVIGLLRDGGFIPTATVTVAEGNGIFGVHRMLLTSGAMPRAASNSAEASCVMDSIP